MKEIVLNDEQVFMLRDMLRSLFSDLIPEGDKPSDTLGVTKYEKSNTCCVFLNKDDGCERVQWLEFCIFYVQPKLGIYINTMTIRALRGHYINTLYKKFKSIQDANHPRVEEKESH
jgi:hypothetical protein